MKFINSRIKNSKTCPTSSGEKMLRLFNITQAILAPLEIKNLYADRHVWNLEFKNLGFKYLDLKNSQFYFDN